MQKSKDGSGKPGRSKRSVEAILARRRRDLNEYRRTLPPDFLHGEVAVGEVYDVFGRRWVERALFVVDDGDVVTTARFEEHFLVIEQWSSDCDTALERWWRERRNGDDRIVMLTIDEERLAVDDAEISMEIDRGRLRQLEQGAVGVTREGMTAGRRPEHRLCRSEIDMLSLVTLTSRLGTRDIS